MMLRLQRERMAGSFDAFRAGIFPFHGLDREKLKFTNLMH